MEDIITCEYMYEKNLIQGGFYMVPKILDNKVFNKLSFMSKILYAIMLDRASISVQNNWIDNEKGVYIVMPIRFIAEKFECGKNKAMEMMRSLEEVGLIERVSKGIGKAQSIFVKKIVINKEEDNEINTADDNDTILSSNESAFKNSEKKSADDEFTKDLQGIKNRVLSHQENVTENLNVQNIPIDVNIEDVANAILDKIKSGITDIVSTCLGATVEKSHNCFKDTSSCSNDKAYLNEDAVSLHEDTNNTKYNNTKNNNLILSKNKISNFRKIRSDEEYSAYLNLIKENIKYDDLLETHPLEKETIDGIVDLMTETMLYKKDKLLVARNYYPTELVKSKLLKLTYSHIEYVLTCLSGNTTKVRNIKKYMLAVLFNAKSTMDTYYSAEVNYNLCNVGQESAEKESCGSSPINYKELEQFLCAN